MYIPKFRIVDAYDLANEYDIPHLELYLEDIVGHVPLAEDHIRTWKDDDWDRIPAAVKRAYGMLCDAEGFNEGDIFIWRL